MKITLHAGAPKTGSTSLQHMFLENQQLLADNGIRFLPRSILKKNVHPIYKPLVSLSREENLSTITSDEIRSLLSVEADSGVEHLLISYEAVFGNFFMKEDLRNCSRHDDIIQYLNLAFIGHHVEVVFFIRNLAEFVKSIYVQDVRQGGYMNFEAYYSKMLDINTLSWLPIIQSLQNGFGTSSLKIVSYEAFKNEPIGIIGDAIPDLKPAIVDIAVLPFKNKSVGRDILAIYRILNLIIMKRLALKRSGAAHRKVRKYLLLPLEKLSIGNKLMLPKKVSTVLEQNYARDIQWIEAELKSNFIG